MRRTLAGAALALTTCALHAQTNALVAPQPVYEQPPIQGWVIQQTDPKDLVIQQEAMDKSIQHMQDQSYKSLQRYNAHLSCAVNSWHPENCE